MTPARPFSSPLSFSTERMGDAQVLHVSGAATIDQVDALRAQIAAAVAASDRALVLDLLGVDFLTSDGLGAIVAAHREFANRGRLVCALRPRTPLRKLLSLTHVDQFVPIYDDLDVALRAATA